MAIILSGTHTAQEPTQITENIRSSWTYFFLQYGHCTHCIHNDKYTKYSGICPLHAAIFTNIERQKVTLLMRRIISPHLEYSSAKWILQWIYVCRNHLEKV